MIQAKLLPWLKTPAAYLASLRADWVLFSHTMVDKEKLAATEARPNKPVAAVKLEEAQPKASGGSVHLEPTLPQEARKCFVTTTKGSKLLLFLKPTLDVKQILSEDVT